MDTPADLAPDLTPVASLIGTWKGEGAGSYPTIDDFVYSEEITFADVGKPFLHYVQKTRGPSGAPMHTETGYLRIPGNGTAEFVLTQPTGQAELWRHGGARVPLESAQQRLRQAGQLHAPAL